MASVARITADTGHDYQSCHLRACSRPFPSVGRPGRNYGWATCGTVFKDRIGSRQFLGDASDNLTGINSVNNDLSGPVIEGLCRHVRLGRGQLFGH